MKNAYNMNQNSTISHHCIDDNFLFKFSLQFDQDQRYSHWPRKQK
jgi:hypothetical protein